jgi:hypothetical protein
MANAGKKLVASEVEVLRTCEATIERNLNCFIEVAQALQTIKEKNLFRATHDTFGDYCKERWNITGTHGLKLIRRGKVAKRLSKDLPPPSNLAQTDAMEGLSKPKQKAVWEKAVNDAASPKPTQRQVLEARLALTGSTGIWRGGRYSFVRDLVTMADRFSECYTETEIHEFVSLLMARLARKKAA